MKTAAIIAEYNPFHEGHRYQIEETRKITGADYILVIMSGDFVQRGAPAIFNKYRRTKEALLGGADAVIELPSLYAVSSAEFFAGGGVTLLNQLGMVDYLSFGSESGDIDQIRYCANLLIDVPPSYQNALSLFLKQGLSYPAARNKAVLKTVCPPVSDQSFTDISAFSVEEINALFSSPNNILAVEYCKALHALKSSVKPVTVKRQGAGYHEDSLSDDPMIFNSASAIRKAMEQGRLPYRQRFFIPSPLQASLRTGDGIFRLFRLHGRPFRQNRQKSIIFYRFCRILQSLKIKRYYLYQDQPGPHPYSAQYQNAEKLQATFSRKESFCSLCKAARVQKGLCGSSLLHKEKKFCSTDHQAG